VPKDLGPAALYESPSGTVLPKDLGRAAMYESGAVLPSSKFDPLLMKGGKKSEKSRDFMWISLLCALAVNS